MYNNNRFYLFYNIYKFCIILSLNEVRFAEYKTVEVKV